MKRVGFILKPEHHDGHSESRQIAEQLIPWLRQHNHVPVISDEDRLALLDAEIVPRDDLGKHVDMAVVLGGDGTMLGASALVADEGVPVLGINLGNLGFLTGFDRGEAQDALAQALAGELNISQRMRLAVTYESAEGETVTRTALNDAVIHQGSMARLIDLDAYVSTDHIASYRADGLIMCTPTGSTAYNLAAGGPIIMPGQDSMVVTPICAHTLTSRPLVLPSTVTLRIRLAGESRGVVLTLDGQWARSFWPGDQVSITRAEKPLLLFESHKRYFDVLREKLHWDSRPVLRRKRTMFDP